MSRAHDSTARNIYQSVGWSVLPFKENLDKRMSSFSLQHAYEKEIKSKLSKHKNEKFSHGWGMKKESLFLHFLKFPAVPFFSFFFVISQKVTTEKRICKVDGLTKKIERKEERKESMKMVS